MLAAWVRREEIKAAREQGRLEGYAKGYVESRALERKVWQEWRRALEAWEQRKADAKHAGQQFNEPRPAPPADD